MASNINPLDPPQDHRLLSEFMQYFHLSPSTDREKLLRDVASAFARLPYENLSKIIRFADRGSVAASRESPAEILAGHAHWGTGGTCFSLTATLLHLIRSLGYEAHPILADRRYGPNTHCALLVTMDNQPHLLDPGYLIVAPVRFTTSTEQTIATPFHDVVLAPHDSGGKIDLLTSDTHGKRQRLTFKTSPVDDAEFLRAWDESFRWEMMHYPVLTRIIGHQQVYLRGSYHQIRDRDGVVRNQIPRDKLADQIATQFGIHRAIVEQALAVLGTGY